MEKNPTPPGAFAEIPLYVKRKGRRIDVLCSETKVMSFESKTYQKKSVYQYRILPSNVAFTKEGTNLYT